MSPDISTIKHYLLTLQATLCQQLQQVDGRGEFAMDNWQRPEQGGGCTCAFVDGAVIEKAGVNFSHVYGKNLPTAATHQRPELLDATFQALGLSLIVHPGNPYVPTAHLNIRFFVAEKPNQAPVWWFGGGFDLTPYYGFVEDCVHWHRVAQTACQPFGDEVYPRYKKWADDYFYLKHRQENRGIGGLFFDDLHCWDFNTCFAFMRSVGDHFSAAYLPIVERRKGMPYAERERKFQCYRRGRYVEFNLVYDRGTLFGLQWGGRTESILISLPPQVSWYYDWQLPPDSVETRLMADYLTPEIGWHYEVDKNSIAAATTGCAE